MTVDGELKRQIFQLDYVQIDTIKVENLGDVLGEKINEILDEVAKEFPLLLEGVTIKSKTCGDISADIFACAEWFKKWFLGSEQK
jgi:hypothetical protein